MRRKNREINVISLSALDLFCCALGGFIIITALALPFVPNISPIDPTQIMEELEEMTERAQTAEEAQAELEAQVEALEQSIEAKTSDIIIVLDSTGSMQNEIDAIRAEIVDLSTILSKIAGDTRIGFVEFKDQCEVNSLRVMPLTPINQGQLPDIQSFLSGTFAGGTCNPDGGPEDLYRGFVRATQADWKAPEENRMIMIIGDQMTYPGFENRLIDEVRGFAQSGQRVSTRYTGSGTGSAQAIAQYYQSLARQGNGIGSSQSSGSFALSLLLAVSK